MYSGFIINYICNAKCRHCMYASSPKIKDDYKFIDKNNALTICEKLSRNGFKSMHIGGGEPFVKFDSLCDLLSAFKKYGINVDYIETNAFWCNEDNESEVNEKLDILRSFDVDTVMVSIDPFHIEYAPLYKPLLLRSILRKKGFRYFIWQEKFLDMLYKLDHKKCYKREELERIFGNDYIKNAVREYGMGINGRALAIAREIYKPKKVQEILLSAPCTNILTAQHCHIDLFGNYIPSGCPGISVQFDDYISGNVTEAKYPIVTRMREYGIESLYQYAVDNGFAAYDKGYINKCDLCYHIRSYLIDVKPSYDIAPKCFYDIMKSEYLF